MTTTAHSMPRASGRTDAHNDVAPVLSKNSQIVQTVLYVAGAILMPTGLTAIILGWYGAANTPYEYDQLSYLVSGGLLGLGLTFMGGFLYFGAWLARIATDQRAASRQLADAIYALAAAQSTTTQAVEAEVPLVVAGAGGTVHRADCDLLTGRTDVRPAGPEAPALEPCRLCRPVVPSA
ncbi:MAG TPA: hypothetical protein VFK41_10410 [Nocardioidaceae bacterium]|nr:hypothetical protein [Nocardioidaceae bacterium]